MRDLHDGAQQRLIAVALSMQQAGEAAHRLDPQAPLAHRVDEAISELLAAVDELRRLARGIHPAILTEEGLAPAVAGLARRSPYPSGSTSRWPTAALGGRGHGVLHRRRGADQRRQARRRTSGRRLHSPGATRHLDVEVSDNGAGGADGSRGSGLLGMADRLDALSGTLVVESPVRWRHPAEGGHPVRVIVADDSAVIRAGVSRILAGAGHRRHRRGGDRRRSPRRRRGAPPGPRRARHPDAAHGQRRPARGGEDP